MSAPDTIPTSISRIQKRVAEHYEISVEDMMSARRNPNIVRPRHVAMHLAVKLTEKSFPVIGKCFNKDHTTVMYANTQIPRLMPQDLRLNSSVNFLMREFAGIDMIKEEKSVELAIDQLVSSISEKLRRRLRLFASSDPGALLDALKDLDGPSRRFDS